MAVIYSNHMPNMQIFQLLLYIYIENSRVKFYTLSSQSKLPYLFFFCFSLVSVKKFPYYLNRIRYHIFFSFLQELLRRYHIFFSSAVIISDRVCKFAAFHFIVFLFRFVLFLSPCANRRRFWHFCVAELYIWRSAVTFCGTRICRDVQATQFAAFAPAIFLTLFHACATL